MNYMIDFVEKYIILLICLIIIMSFIACSNNDYIYMRIISYGNNLISCSKDAKHIEVNGQMNDIITRKGINMRADYIASDGNYIYILDASTGIIHIVGMKNNEYFKIYNDIIQSNYQNIISANDHYLVTAKRYEMKDKNKTNYDIIVMKKDSWNTRGIKIEENAKLLRAKEYLKYSICLDDKYIYVFYHCAQMCVKIDIENGKQIAQYNNTINNNNSDKFNYTAKMESGGIYYDNMTGNYSLIDDIIYYTRHFENRTEVYTRKLSSKRIIKVADIGIRIKDSGALAIVKDQIYYLNTYGRKVKIAKY